MATIKLNNREYTLATTLRVAYLVQGQNNHKSYTELFSSIDEMTLEKQIDILYASFKVGNPEDAKTITCDMFRMLVMDDPEFNISVLMDLLMQVISGITGMQLETIATEEIEEIDGKN